MAVRQQELEKRGAAMPEGVEHVRACEVYAPNVDILEGENEITLAVDMPGVDEKSVDITLEKQVLTVHGTTTTDVPERFNVVREECRSGDYERKFVINHEIDADAIRASVRDGVLRVRLPKSEAAKTRKIKVSAA